VIRLHLTAADARRIRFASSPLWEAVTSLRTLTDTSLRWQLHQPWRDEVRGRLDRVDMSVLTAVVRPAGYVPDFLVPAPARRHVAFHTALTELAATDPSQAAGELIHLAGHPVAQRGPGRDQRVAMLHELAADPAAALARIAQALDDYWRAAVAPFWLRLQALLQDDLAYRLDQLADGGVDALLRGLHPSVRFDGTTLNIDKYYDCDASTDGRGMLLVPCAFAWPDVMVRTAQPLPVTISYSPRGVGRLWERHPHSRHTALAEVLGRTRTDLLRLLDLPMATSQLATQLAVSAPTLNAHLKALHAAGIVAARRDGRFVLYSRTPVGDLLIAQP
jgi:hypothetical protein